MDKSNYQNLVPIIPTQRIAVFNNMQSGKPYIVYTYAEVGYSINTWERMETMAYTIYSDDEMKLRQIIHALTDLLHRYDDTAREVDAFINSADRPIDSDDRKFMFNYVTVTGTMGPEPYTTEGGRQAASVTLRYCFMVDEDNAGMRS